MLFISIVFLVFVFYVFCFIFIPFKIIKSKKIDVILKGVIIGGIFGLWFWIKDYDFFINIGGPDMKLIRALRAYTSIPAVWILVVFFSVIGLLMGLLVKLLVKILSRK